MSKTASAAICRADVLEDRKRRPDRHGRRHLGGLWGTALLDLSAGERDAAPRRAALVGGAHADAGAIDHRAAGLADATAGAVVQIDERHLQRLLRTVASSDGLHLEIDRLGR